MQDDLTVFVDEKLAGELIREGDSYIFSYKSDDKESFISLTMPVRSKQYINDALHPIFEMHLPEGYLLSIIKKHFSKIAKTDNFGLLHLLSDSINTRITYNPKQQKEEKLLTLEEIITPNSNRLFEELVSRFALNSSLSGVQPKVLATVENKATLKVEDYIVKSWGEEYPQLALNEYYCMKLVKYANIEVPEFYISKDEKLFIMKRFDILEDDSKLGFEDMCVLQAKQRDDKYEGSYEQIAKSIKTFVSPKYKKSSLKQYFKQIVINNIIQNGDAHLKNFAIVYKDIKNIKLSPAYDVVSTTVYIQNDIPALLLLGSKKWWDKKYILRFGVESCDLTQSEASEMYKECVKACKKVLQEIDKRLESERDSEKVMILEHLMGMLRDVH